MYLERRAERYHAEALRSYEILGTQVAWAEGELKEVEKRRLQFIRDNNLIAFDLQKEALEVSKLTELEDQIAGAQTRLAGLSAALTQLDQQYEWGTREPVPYSLLTYYVLVPLSWLWRDDA